MKEVHIPGLGDEAPDSHEAYQESGSHDNMRQWLEQVRHIEDVRRDHGADARHPETQAEEEAPQRRGHQLGGGQVHDGELSTARCLPQQHQGEAGVLVLDDEAQRASRREQDCGEKDGPAGQESRCYGRC